jgi:hypothetical protein
MQQQILANFDNEGIIVYQAFNPSIAEAVVHPIQNAWFKQTPISWNFHGNNTDSLLTKFLSRIPERSPIGESEICHH